MMVTSLYAGLAALALAFLSVRVIRLRRKTRISVGHANSPDLERAMRVQGNFTEYTPIFLILLGLAEARGWPVSVLHLAGTVFLAGRLFHFAGFRSAAAPGKLRVAGMALTLTATVCLGAAFLIATIVGV